MRKSLENTTRILVRSGKSPLDVLSNEAAAARKSVGVFASNAGNLLFTNSVHRALNVPGVETVADSLTVERKGVTNKHIHRINDEFDCYVVPLANAFRESFRPHLRRLTAAIQQLNVPVVVTGVGSQVGVDGDTSGTSTGLDEDSREFVKAVLDRSASIGVRGDITKRYLIGLGFPESSVDIIGCPSMNDFDGEAPVLSRNVAELSRETPLAINITPRVRGMAEVLARHHAAFDDLVYVPQIHEELLLTLWGQSIKKYPNGLPASIDHYMYREGKMRFFTDATPWRKFLAERDFAFGNRLHGNVAALSSGTPSMLLVHDSRTLELAEFHKMPFTFMPDDSTTVDAKKLFQEADLDSFNKARQGNREIWQKFLERNSLSHIHTQGNENPRYSEQLANANHPDGVEPLTTAPREQLVTRLRWVWQGIKTDQNRPEGAYKPPFEPENQTRSSAADIAKKADKRSKDLAGQISELQVQIETLKQEQDELRASRPWKVAEYAKRAGRKVQRTATSARKRVTRRR